MRKIQCGLDKLPCFLSISLPGLQLRSGDDNWLLWRQTFLLQTFQNSRGGGESGCPRQLVSLGLFDFGVNVSPKGPSKGFLEQVTASQSGSLSYLGTYGVQ